MTRSIIKAAQWTLGVETAEGAPEGVYSAECITCGAQAQPTDNEDLPVEVWALKHTGLNPTHRQFKAMHETFWRVAPAEGNPFRELGAQRESESEQAESDAQHISRQEGAARMRWLGAPFERIAYAYGYADAQEAQRDYEECADCSSVPLGVGARGTSVPDRAPNVRRLWWAADGVSAWESV